ncbi:hypothetical protein MJI95_09895, partial [Salmonella enterica subsp. enterica serovar Kentucky]|nr:hypothetical protein [Salmonella enterica subsp. enterica serovar Kentucky]
KFHHAILCGQYSSACLVFRRMNSSSAESRAGGGARVSDEAQKNASICDKHHILLALLLPVIVNS